MYCPIGVGFLRRFGLETGINFAHFGLESGMVSRELRSVWEYISFNLQMSKKQREMCESVNNFFLFLL